MPTVYFRGRVLPRPIEISFQDIPQSDWEWQEEGLTLHFVVRIVKSAVEVECRLDRFQNDYIAELHRHAYDLARASVNVAAFATGFGVTVFFEEFVGPNGVPTALIFPNPDLVPICTSFKLPPNTPEEKKDLEMILGIVMSEPALFMALNDLVQGVSTPHMTPVNCGRVVDALRKLIAPGVDPKRGWPIFQTTLQADEAYLTFISEHSKESRHGGHVRIDGPTTQEIALRTWTIMNRFLEFKKRGNQPLLQDEFPLLVG